MSSTSETTREYQLTFKPRDPETVSSITRQLPSFIEQALRDAGQEQLLTNGQFRYEMKRPGGDPVVVLLFIYVLAPIAVKTYEEVVLPLLKAKVNAWLEQQRLK